jgi:hypothetical protein
VIGGTATQFPRSVDAELSRPTSCFTPTSTFVSGNLGSILIDTFPIKKLRGQGDPVARFKQAQKEFIQVAGLADFDPRPRRAPASCAKK